MADAQKKKKKPVLLSETCPLEDASILGWSYYTWVSPFLWRAYRLAKGTDTDKKQVDIDDVYQNPACMNPSRLADNFEAYYAEGGLKKVMKKVLTVPIIKCVLVHAGSASLLVVIPILTSKLLKSIKDHTATLTEIIQLSVAFFLALVLKSVLENANLFMVFSAANQFQLGMIAAIQRKALRLSAASRQKFSAGVGVNIIGVDPLRMFNFIGNIPYMIICPYHILLAVVVLSLYVGWSVLAGVACIVAFFPVQALIVKFSARFRKQLNKLSDDRLRLTQETLQGIRLLKYFAWEPVFLRRIEELRRAELGRVRRLMFLQAINNGTVFWLPVFGGSAVVALHAWRNLDAFGNFNLDGGLIYLILIMMNYLGTPIYIIPSFGSSLVAAKAAQRRLEEYFEASEAPSHVKVDANADDAVVLKQAQFSWETLPPSELGSKKSKKSKKGKLNETTTVTADHYAKLAPLDLSIKKGSFVVVVGEVGSGKSSLLAALIGEMKLTGGEASVFVRENDHIAYCPQQAWIMAGTFKDNVLFGRPFDAHLYNRALEESCLAVDLTQLPAGDATEIGEGGAGLSGGQKQRLSLARALYSRAEIYLLDDPISAVDSNVARKLLYGCFVKTGSLVDGATRILVTHQVGLLKELGSKIDTLIVMKDCRVAYAGPFDMAQIKVKAIQHAATVDEATGTEKTNMVEEADPLLASTPVPQAEENTKEERAPVLPMFSGRNKFWLYFSSASIFWSVFVVGCLLATTELVKIYKDMFLNDATEGRIANMDTRTILLFYTALGFCQGVIACLTGVVYGCIVSYRAGQRVHISALLSLLKTTMAFFDQVQLGSLLERFGSDLMSTDTVLPEKALQVLAVVGSILSSVGMLLFSCLVTGQSDPSRIPAWQAVPALVLSLLPLAAFIIGCWYLFTGGWSPIQHIIGRAAGRVTGVFTESLGGLPTLRSFRMARLFGAESERRIDALGRSVILALAMRRWVSVRIDLATTILVLLTIVMSLWLNLPPTFSGLLMLYSLNTAYLLEWCIKQFAEVESNLNSFDRIAALGSVLDDESVTTTKSLIAANVDESWPRVGALRIDSLTVRYRPDLPPTLKGISLNIQPGQKVAIVGRTGAGKSSIIAAIYRMSHAPDSGSILLDGIDIATVPLPILRQRLSIVPQDPVLFSGTLRFNLDPEGRYPDDALWKVLEATRMHKDVSQHPLKLDLPVEEAGSNFSIGQRQLLCLARALLRDPAPLLLIDEATANVDFDTDAAIQAALRQHLQERPGTTLITIAHRIATVMDYDRVAVLGHGQVIEFGSPAELLATPNGHFRQMADKAGIAVPQL